MNTALKKEFTKIGVLLFIGIILNIVFISKYNATLSSDSLGMLIFLVYPVGLFYGWRKMRDVFIGGLNGHKTGDPYYDEVDKRSVSAYALQFGISATLAIGIAWIYGLYAVVKQLLYLKNNY